MSLILEQLEKKGVEPITKSQVSDIQMNLMQLTTAELVKMQDNKKLPRLVEVFVKALLDGKKDFYCANEMLNRSHGTPTQSIDQKTELIGDIIVKLP